MSVIPEYRRRKFFNTTANAPANDHSIAEVGKIGVQASDRMSRSKMGLVDTVFNASASIGNNISKLGDSIFEAGYRIKEAKYQKSQDELRARAAAQQKADTLAYRAQQKADTLAYRAQQKAEKIEEAARREEEKIQDKLDRFNASNKGMMLAVSTTEDNNELYATVKNEKDFKETAVRRFEDRRDEMLEACDNDGERMYLAEHSVNVAQNAFKSINTMVKSKRINNATETFDNAKKYVVSESRNVAANEMAVRDYMPAAAQSVIAMTGQLDGIVQGSEIERQRAETLEAIAENAFRGVKSKDLDLALRLLDAGVFTKAKLSATGRDYVLVRDEKKIEAWREELQMEITRKAKNDTKDAHASFNNTLANEYESLTGVKVEGKELDDSPDKKAAFLSAVIATGNPEAVKTGMKLLENISKTDEFASDKLSQQTELDLSSSYAALTNKGMRIKDGVPVTGAVTLNDLAAHQLLVMDAFASGKISDKKMRMHLNAIQPMFGKMTSKLGEDPIGPDIMYDNDTLTMAWAKRMANKTYNPAVAANVVPHNRYMETVMLKIAQYRNANGGEDITKEQIDEIKATMTEGKPLLDERTGTVKTTEKGS